MAELDELEALARVAERDEEAAEEARRLELGEEPQQPEAPTAPPPGELEAGAKRAEVVLGVLSAGLENFADKRLALPAEEIEAGRDNLGPALAKYGLTGGGDGDIPYAVEVRAGFYLGGLVKRIWRRIKEIAKHDKEQREQREKEYRNHGQEPQHETTQPAYAVSGQFGIREESDTADPIVNS